MIHRSTETSLTSVLKTICLSPSANEPPTPTVPKDDRRLHATRSFTNLCYYQLFFEGGYGQYIVIRIGTSRVCTLQKFVLFR